MVSAWPDLTMVQAVARSGASRAVISETPCSARPGIGSPDVRISVWRARAAWTVGLWNSGKTMFIG